MYKPKVSVIVPIYNVEKYFERCMRSLLNQTLKEIEIILVDDESPDNCPAMCDEYARTDNRVKVIHKKNEGLGFARNSGLEIATGEYVAFVDSDDFVKETMYEELYKEAKSKCADIVFCNFYKYSTTGIIKEESEVEEPKIFNGSNDISKFLMDMIGSEPTYPIDRKYTMSVWKAIYSNYIIQVNNVIFPSERELISEDLIFHIRLLPLTNIIAYTNKYYYYYCENQTSLSKMYRSDRFDKYKLLHKELLIILFKMKFFCKTRITLAVDRLFIGYVRNMILTTVNSNKEIKYIFDDEYLREVINRYPCNHLPFKHRIFIMLAKYRQIILIRLLSKG